MRTLGDVEKIVWTSNFSRLLSRSAGRRIERRVERDNKPLRARR